VRAYTAAEPTTAEPTAAVSAATVATAIGATARVRRLLLFAGFHVVFQMCLLRGVHGLPGVFHTATFAATFAGRATHAALAFAFT